LAILKNFNLHLYCNAEYETQRNIYKRCRTVLVNISLTNSLFRQRRMAILDQQGRLFGKFSILDIGAIATVLIVLVGLLIVPGNSGSSIAQILTAENKTVQVVMNVRGLSATDPQELVKVGDEVNIVIRNQPRGKVKIAKVDIAVPKIVAAKADGTAVFFDDPRAVSTFQSDLAITLEATAQITNDGAVFAGEKVKVGTSIDIEGSKYIIRGSAMAVRY
jgi:ribosomal protein L14